MQAIKMQAVMGAGILLLGVSTRGAVIFTIVCCILWRFRDDPRRRIHQPYGTVVHHA